MTTFLVPTGLRVGMFACLLVFSFHAAGQEMAVPGRPLPAWRSGCLDIHHINTGRGNAAFFIFPDGTNMLVDAGELDPTEPRTTSARNAVIRPNGSRQPYEWIVDYIRQFSPVGEKTEIDYALVTHFHDDHFGSWYPQAPASSDRSFKRSGITGVGDLIPIHYSTPQNSDQ